MGLDDWHHHRCHVGNMVVAWMSTNQMICYTCKRGVEVRGVSQQELVNWLGCTGWGITTKSHARCPMCRGHRKRQADKYYWVRMAINEPLGSPFMYECINGGHRKNRVG